MDTRFGVRVCEWKAVLSLVSGERGVDDDQDRRRRVRGLAGSHKSNVPVPPDVMKMLKQTESVRNPEIEKGDVLLFTEACTHGTIPWTGEGRDGKRRAVLYRLAGEYGVRSIVLAGVAKRNHGRDVRRGESGVATTV